MSIQFAINNSLLRYANYCIEMCPCIFHVRCKTMNKILEIVSTAIDFVWKIVRKKYLEFHKCSTKFFTRLLKTRNKLQSVLKFIIQINSNRVHEIRESNDLVTLTPCGRKFSM